MTDTQRTLQIISNEVKEAASKLDIVTPSIYSSLFSQKAHEYNLKLDDEKSLSENIIQAQCSSLQKLQSETSKSADQLSQSTSKAISAIEERDTDSLKEVLQETKALRKEIEKLKASVYKDELTHAYNRKWLHDHYIEDENILNITGSLVLIDLNYFKEINDTFGHIIGDKVLIFITNKLKNVSKEVIRYGGDEFLLIFKHQNIQEIKNQLHMLREKIISKKLKAHNEEFHVSFSYGITSFLKGASLAKTIENADKAMYVDKINIKKRVQGI
jgi:diguanylate cyclase (GGDEF)-like protein